MCTGQRNTTWISYKNPYQHIFLLFFPVLFGDLDMNLYQQAHNAHNYFTGSRVRSDFYQASINKSTQVDEHQLSTESGTQD